MKKLILTCGIVIIIMGDATAQVSKSDFTTQVGSLNEYIKKGNATGQASAINIILSLMNKQTHWLGSDIDTKQAKYTSGYNQLAQLNSMTVNPADRASYAAREDSLTKKIAALKGQIDGEKRAFDTEKNMNTDVLLSADGFANRPEGDKTKVLTDLHTFAGTLN